MEPPLTPDPERDGGVGIGPNSADAGMNNGGSDGFFVQSDAGIQPPTPDNMATEPEAVSGCNCDIGSANTGPSPIWTIMALLSLGLLRRRRS